MYVRQRDVVVGTALVLYIVFFALSPPAVVRTILSQPIGVAASFGVAIYITLYYSRPIGAILIVALLASMTSVTEHMTDSERSSLQTELTSVNATVTQLRGMGLSPDSNDALKNAIARQSEIQRQLSAPPTASSTTSGSGSSSELADLNKTISELQGMGLRPETNDALKNALARRDQLQRGATPPMTTPTAPAASSPAPAMPPSAAPPTSAPARPVMACNIENFAPF